MSDAENDQTREMSDFEREWIQSDAGKKFFASLRPMTPEQRAIFENAPFAPVEAVRPSDAENTTREKIAAVIGRVHYPAGTHGALMHSAPSPEMVADALIAAFPTLTTATTASDKKRRQVLLDTKGIVEQVLNDPLGKTFDTPTKAAQVSLALHAADLLVVPGGTP